ncbi:MAG TPA: VC0807 family protein [Bryobacteraceae bacterium]|jgi:hypothetical protein
MLKQPTSPFAIFLGYLLDIVAPIATYFALHRLLGLSDFWALIAGSFISVFTTAVNTIRRKRLDRVGVLVLLEIGASIALLFVTRDPRLLLVKPSFYTAIAGVYMIATSFRGRPLTYEGVKQVGTKGDPLRTAAFERAWEQSSPFRSSLRISAIGWGIAFIADAVIRAVIVYRFPLARAAWLSNLPHLAALILLILFSALMGRKTKRIVDEQVQQLTLQEPAN